MSKPTIKLSQWSVHKVKVLLHLRHCTRTVHRSQMNLDDFDDKVNQC